VQGLLQAIVNGLVAGSILTLPAMGFSAIFAVLRYPSFAVGALASFGAYAGWIANRHWGVPVELALPVAFVVAALVGMLAEWVAIRPLEKSGTLMMAVASLALSFLLENLLRFGFGNDLRGFDLPLLRDFTWGPLRMGPQQIKNMGLALAVMLAVWAFLRLSNTGRAMRAVADNPDLARLRGIDPTRVAMITVAMGSGLAGVGGMLLGLDTSIDPMTGTRLMLSIFAASVLGGLGSIPGAVAGAMVIGVVEELTVFAISPAYRTPVGFLVILLVLSWRPSGLFVRRAEG
jgi:branched-subunit amino acid ABC-type transport system permease component